MKNIFAVMLALIMMTMTFAVAESSPELNAYPMVNSQAIQLAETELFEIENYEILELNKITFVDAGPIEATFTYSIQFSGDEVAMICFETEDAFECYIFEDAVIENNNVTITFSNEVIEVAGSTNTYLAIAKVTAVG